MKITIVNTFHKVECIFNLREGQQCLSRAQMVKLRRDLCGVSDCKCLFRSLKMYNESNQPLYSELTFAKDSKGQFETLQVLG